MIVDVQCDTGIATLSWVKGQGSLQYFTMAETMDGHTLHCDTNSTSCSIHGLTFGSLYNFSALASDGTCNSSLTVPIQKGAGIQPDLSENVTGSIYLKIIEFKTQNHFTHVMYDIYITTTIRFCIPRMIFLCVLVTIFSIKHIFSSKLPRDVFFTYSFFKYFKVAILNAICVCNLYKCSSDLAIRKLVNE